MKYPTSKNDPKQTNLLGFSYFPSRVHMIGIIIYDVWRMSKISNIQNLPNKPNLFRVSYFSFTIVHMILDIYKYSVSYKFRVYKYDFFYWWIFAKFQPKKYDFFIKNIEGSFCFFWLSLSGIYENLAIFFFYGWSPHWL
jgi:hypothetical protein